ncbi:MAG: ribonuclease HI [Bacteroidales bacterium]|nr:ribonuclease HI [Bacteroidales bacterium]MCL2738015.1 ribonuclease HI [Bacteroidales bacterium]
MHPIALYTDGAAKGNPGPGGYGVVLVSGPYRKELSGGVSLTTNNRMELLAVIVGLEALKIPGSQVTVYSDSTYVVNAIEKGWLLKWQAKGFKKAKNIDLWLRFLHVWPKYRVNFVWIKGHSGHPENERCDRLATEAAGLPNLPPDSGYTPEQEVFFGN